MDKQIKSASYLPTSRSMKEGEWRFSSRARRLFHKFGGLLHEFWAGEPLLADGSSKMREGSVLRAYNIDTYGTLRFRDAGGMVFGSCYGDHIGWSQANAAQNTWYNIADADMADGVLHNVTHDGNGKLTVTEPGMYLVDYSCCFEDNVANDHIEVGIEVSSSGSADVAGRSHLENKFANEEEHASSSCILDLADNATLEVAIRTTDNSTPTISVQSVNLTCVQIGGT